MSEKPDGGPAFPHEADYVLDHTTGKATFRVDFHPGMSLRDWFAGRAMQGMLGCQGFMNELCSKEGSRDGARDRVSEWAVAQANSMLAELDKPDSTKGKEEKP